VTGGGLPSRPTRWAVGVLVLLAYLPALTAAPGRMPADSKLYLYLDPGGFLGDAASTFDPRQFAGWVPHQHVAYLWPSGPWFWLFDTLGVPDWVAHRLWLGTLLFLGGLGVRWCARTMGLVPAAALVAAVVYQVSPYVLPYVSRTSVMLLPWAGLGWIVGLTVRATQQRSWRDPALVALVVFTVGAVNATALAMIVPAPVLYLVHAAWQRSVSWRDAAIVAGRVALLTVPVSLWWIVMLLVQGRYGAEVLPYSESLADVSLTATGPEVWRSLGYWLFYVRDAFGATTTESLRYLSSTPAIAVSYLVPIVGLAGLAFTRWAHRRYAALLVVAGAVLAVGVHPIDDRAPLMRLLAGDDEGGLALALRSSTRALPMMNLGLALGAASLVAAIGASRLRRPAWPARPVVAAAVVALAVANLPALWTGGFVDPALERDQEPPSTWRAAADALDESGHRARVLQVPGAEFGAFGWGYTVDQPLPGLTDKPLVTRDLLPLGSPGAMDLLYALDDRMQDGVLEPRSVAPVARWLGADTLWLTRDLDVERFRTARPADVGRVLAAADDVTSPTPFGDDVTLYEVEPGGSVVRTGDTTVLVAGSGDGLVDLAAAGLLDGDEVVRYSAEGLDAIAAPDRPYVAVLVTDSNRDRARHWRSSQDTLGATESDGPGTELLREVASDQRLPVFAPRDAAVAPVTQTVARQIGPVTATATSYGEPFAYLPEHRPAMAIDGTLDTAWTVGEHADPIGEVLRLDAGRSLTSIGLVQAWPGGGRRITEVGVRIDGGELRRIPLDDRSLTSPGQPVDVSGGTRVDVEILAVGGGEPGTAGAVQGVGFAEIVTGLAPTVEVVRPPHDALATLSADDPLALVFTRLRADADDPWRDDPEPALVRGFELPVGRELDVTVDVRVDPRADDRSIADLFGLPAWASTRRTGDLAAVGASAVDGAVDTAWRTARDRAVGSVLHLPGGLEPVGSIDLRQPDDTSRITELVLRAGDDERRLAVAADADGSSTLVVDPPLPAGPLSVEISAIEPAIEVDRRYGDRFVASAGIAEISAPGWPTASPVSTAVADLGCVPLLDVDGRVLAFDVRVVPFPDEQPSATTPRAAPCDDGLVLDAGEHVVRALDGVVDGGLPIQVDRVVLDGGAIAALATAGANRSGSPEVRSVSGGRFERSVEVTGCDRGCWLVFGEGFNEAWEATIDGVGLGTPVLVDGGFNGWWLPADADPVTVVVRWPVQRRLVLALVVSLLGVVLAAVLALRSRHTADAAHHPVPPMWCWAPDPQPVVPVARRDPLGVGAFLRRSFGARAALQVIGWAAFAALLIGPDWAVWGALAGFVAALWQRPRLPELTALATLVVVAALVVIRERRNAPPPGGGWPGVFESWHGLAMFAVASLLVGAVTADDASLRRERRVDELDGRT
jgi:arabinofuranan 3-O-arabinosyltransferase